MQRGFRLGCALKNRSWPRGFHSTPRKLVVAPAVATATGPGLASLDEFRSRAFTKEQPLLFKKDVYSPSSSLPAVDKWFGEPDTTKFANPEHLLRTGISGYLEKYQETYFPFEVVAPTHDDVLRLSSFGSWIRKGGEHSDHLAAQSIYENINPSDPGRFYQFEAPLEVLLEALAWNHWENSVEDTENYEGLVNMYIAQQSISLLPQELQNDLPAPDIVKHGGKGDVYDSSIWLGTEPTYTPLHRDPNPNLFCQLYSDKIVRLLPPGLGEALFYEVQASLGRQGNSRIRGTAMMEGQEREALHEAVWESGEMTDEMVEADVGAGDALFIPKGWWHSVKSKRSKGQLNASVNWWFR